MDVFEPLGRDELLQPSAQGPVADEVKLQPWIVRELDQGREDGIQVLESTEVAGVHDS